MPSPRLVCQYAYCQHVDQKLRHMDHRTRIITEKKINDILFETEMSALSQNNSRGIIAAEYSGRSSVSHTFSSPPSSFVDQSDFTRGSSLHTYSQTVSSFNDSNNSYAFSSPPSSVTDSNESQTRVILCKFSTLC